MNKPVKPGNWEPSPNNLEPFWMGFTPNRAFKTAAAHDRPRQGHALLRHGGPRRSSTAAPACGAPMPAIAASRIVEAIQKSAAELDFAPTFQFGHPKVFELASRLADHGARRSQLCLLLQFRLGSRRYRPQDRARLSARRAAKASRTRLIGRERGYHGVNFGGISVGGMVANRKWFGAMLAGVDHLPHTYNRKEQAFTSGEPEWGAHLADELERLVALHDASTIAAVIVEPMAGSTGVLPPPKGYLKRLREICDKHGILLIFDEVITGFGRLGRAFAAERFGVVPD